MRTRTARPPLPPSPLLLLPLLLLLQLRHGLAKPPCPAQSPCQCTNLRMKCVQSSSGQLHYLDRVPYFAPIQQQARWSYSFHELRVRDQAMTELSLRYAWGVLSVKKVEVTNSLVRRLAADAFSGLQGVESLNLSHNLLSSIQQRDLQNLSALQELVLHNNKIVTIEPQAFSSTELVSKLYLSHNLLADVPAAVRRLPRLTHLYLQFNNISVVPDGAFSGLRHLIILDLGNLQRQLEIHDAAFCGIGDTSDDDGRGGRGLVALYLRGNIMRSVNLCAISRLRSLRGLNLAGTLLPCSCESLSFTDRSDWSRRYGFSPRFVTFEPWQLVGCDLDCRPAVCPDTCGADAATQVLAKDKHSHSSASCRVTAPALTVWLLWLAVGMATL